MITDQREEGGWGCNVQGDNFVGGQFAEKWGRGCDKMGVGGRNRFEIIHMALCRASMRGEKRCLVTRMKQMRFP